MKKIHLFLFSVLSVAFFVVVGYVFFSFIAPKGAMAISVGPVRITAPIGIMIMATSSPSVAIYANPTTIAQGQTTVITWASTNTTSCTASDALGAASLGTSGSLSETPTSLGTYRYTVTCSGSNGTTNPASVTVAVTATSSVVSQPIPGKPCPAWGCNGPSPIKSPISVGTTSGGTSSNTLAAMIAAIKNATTTDTIVSAANSLGYSVEMGSLVDVASLVVEDPITHATIGSFVGKLP
jgi:hypothetical protein